MAIDDVLKHIDDEIARLQQARTLLAGVGTASTPVRTRASEGRKPAESDNAGSPTKRKRNLSPEGRKAIADAMKRRWADRRKAGSEA